MANPSPRASMSISILTDENRRPIGKLLAKTPSARADAFSDVGTSGLLLDCCGSPCGAFSTKAVSLSTNVPVRLHSKLAHSSAPLP